MSWSRWIRSISLFFLLAACGDTMTAAERDAIASRVLDLSIDDCSISPSRGTYQYPMPKNERCRPLHSIIEQDTGIANGHD